MAFNFIESSEDCLTELKTPTRTNPGTAPSCEEGRGKLLYIYTRCVVCEELGHARWPTFRGFVVFGFPSPHLFRLAPPSMLELRACNEDTATSSQ